MLKKWFNLSLIFCFIFCLCFLGCKDLIDNIEGEENKEEEVTRDFLIGNWIMTSKTVAGETITSGFYSEMRLNSSGSGSESHTVDGSSFSYDFTWTFSGGKLNKTYEAGEVAANEYTASATVTRSLNQITLTYSSTGIIEKYNKD